jgi:hypothetical protein
MIIFRSIINIVGESIQKPRMRYQRSYHSPGPPLSGPRGFNRGNQSVILPQRLQHIRIFPILY